MDNIKWFKEAKYGMMAHWGLYSLLAGEYRGKRVETYAEWIQSYAAIVHYPKTKQGKEKLKMAVTDMHIDAVIKYISKLNCPKEKKEKLLFEIIKDM